MVSYSLTIDQNSVTHARSAHPSNLRCLLSREFSNQFWIWPLFKRVWEPLRDTIFTVPTAPTAKQFGCNFSSFALLDYLRTYDKNTGRLWRRINSMQCKLQRCVFSLTFSSELNKKNCPEWFVLLSKLQTSYRNETWPADFETRFYSTLPHILYVYIINSVALLHVPINESAVLNLTWLNRILCASIFPRVLNGKNATTFYVRCHVRPQQRPLQVID